MIRYQKNIERISIPQNKDTRFAQLAMKHGKMVDMTEQFALALFPMSIRKYVIDSVIADSHLSHLLKNQNITPSNLQDWAKKE